MRELRIHTHENFVPSPHFTIEIRKCYFLRPNIFTRRTRRQWDFPSNCNTTSSHLAATSWIQDISTSRSGSNSYQHSNEGCFTSKKFRFLVISLTSPLPEQDISCLRVSICWLGAYECHLPWVPPLGPTVDLLLLHLFSLFVPWRWTQAIPVSSKSYLEQSLCV